MAEKILYLFILVMIQRGSPSPNPTDDTGPDDKFSEIMAELHNTKEQVLEMKNLLQQTTATLKEYEHNMDILQRTLKKQGVMLANYKKEIEEMKISVVQQNTQIEIQREETDVLRKIVKQQNIEIHERKQGPEALNGFIKQQGSEMSAETNVKRRAEDKPTTVKLDMTKRAVIETSRKRVGEDAAGHVAFYAQLSHDQSHVGNQQPIVFDNVKTNIGSSYNKNDGIFTVSTTGIYIFFWTAMNRQHSHMQTQLIVNGVQFGRAWSDAYDHDDYASASNMVIVSLQAGDTVWISSDSSHSGFISGYNFSTFSGWLLASA